MQWLQKEWKCFFLALACVGSSAVRAQQADLWLDWKEDVSATRWEAGAALAGVTALGLYSWDWGSSKKFRVNGEGWFGPETGSGGADKLGHAFTSYALTNVLAEQLVQKGRSPERAALNAVLTTQAIMLYVEVFDGLSNDHGFSKEDVVMNMAGSALAYARAVHPGLRDKLDFRLEYQSSGYKGFRPLSDYAGQKYVWALKLGGFDALRSLPLRYLELQTGYYARGFSNPEKADGFERSRHGFVGIGLNLGELLFGRKADQEADLKRAARLFFEHIQVPSMVLRKD